MKLSCLLCIYSGGCVFILVVEQLIGVLAVLRCIFLQIWKFYLVVVYHVDKLEMGEI